MRRSQEFEMSREKSARSGRTAQEELWMAWPAQILQGGEGRTLLRSNSGEVLSCPLELIQVWQVFSEGKSLREGQVELDRDHGWSGHELGRVPAMLGYLQESGFGG
ncbi:MAG: hypothetical protein HC904_13260 [Blastochloris sp.]|nr:hypothetical protein [Blastochloris sp.]